jgi:hypothetical protein
MDIPRDGHVRFQNSECIIIVQSVRFQVPSFRKFEVSRRSKFPDVALMQPVNQHHQPQECWLSSFSLSGLWPLLLRSRAFPFTMPLMLVSRCPSLASVPGCESLTHSPPHMCSLPSHCVCVHAVMQWEQGLPVLASGRLVPLGACLHALLWVRVPVCVRQGGSTTLRCVARALDRRGNTRRVVCG